MDFYISDLHLGHANIVKYCGRPFRDQEHMEEVIIQNWNGMVTENDTVYILGDFSLHYKPEKKQQLLDTLNGTKILVIGNHDIRRIGHWAKLGVVAHKKPIVHRGFILSHEPVLFPEIPNIHGHTHGNLHCGEVAGHGIHICVSVETINYTPVSHDQIMMVLSSMVEQSAHNRCDASSNLAGPTIMKENI